MTYKVFSTEWDEVVRPQDLATEGQLKELGKRLSGLLRDNTFKNVEIPEFDNRPVVSILIDNSASMQSGVLVNTIAAAGNMSQYLDAIGVRNEVLGYTTRWWATRNLSAEAWREAGRPENPGRLNALRHVVYKTVDERMDDVHLNLTLMFQPGFLKENIDGEAVQWATERLRGYEESRKIMMVISDGAPIDDSTIFKNGEYYLKNHLKEVVRDIETQGDIELTAMGIGHDISEYYPNGVTIKDYNDLVITSFQKLRGILNIPIPVVTLLIDNNSFAITRLNDKYTFYIDGYSSHHDLAADKAMECLGKYLHSAEVALKKARGRRWWNVLFRQIFGIH